MGPCCCEGTRQEFLGPPSPFGLGCFLNPKCEREKTSGFLSHKLSELGITISYLTLFYWRVHSFYFCWIIINNNLFSLQGHSTMHSSELRSLPYAQKVFGFHNAFLKRVPRFSKDRYDSISRILPSWLNFLIHNHDRSIVYVYLVFKERPKDQTLLLCNRMMWIGLHHCLILNSRIGWNLY